jgi:hypothetical protein
VGRLFKCIFFVPELAEIKFRDTLSISHPPLQSLYTLIPHTCPYFLTLLSVTNSPPRYLTFATNNFSSAGDGIAPVWSVKGQKGYLARMGTKINK